uniref:Uncharacterized protein n=1 Tax=Ciona intestinalis TaxID=7719 RepID=H2XZ23_CIOIN
FHRTTQSFQHHIKQRSTQFVSCQKPGTVNAFSVCRNCLTRVGISGRIQISRYLDVKRTHLRAFTTLLYSNVISLYTV